MGMKQSVVRTTPVARSSGIGDALFSKVQQRVLGVLFGNPNRSFYANEMIAMVASGTGAVQRELARLERGGLLTVKRVGNQKHYQANAQAPVYAELRGLILKTSGLADVLRDALKPLAEDITAAFIYGSVAKGEDTASSDIDLMVVSEILTYADVFALLEVTTRKLGRAVNPAIYTANALARRLKQDNAFIKRVWAQPKIWVVGSESEIPAGKTRRPG
jgi:predicted nucleotidyltransferase